MDEYESVEFSNLPCDDGMGAMTPKTKKTTMVKPINGLEGNTVNLLRGAQTYVTGMPQVAGRAIVCFVGLL